MFDLPTTDTRPHSHQDVRQASRDILVGTVRVESANSPRVTAKPRQSMHSVERSEALHRKDFSAFPQVSELPHLSLIRMRSLVQIQVGPPVKPLAPQGVSVIQEQERQPQDPPACTSGSQRSCLFALERRRPRSVATNDARADRVSSTSTATATADGHEPPSQIMSC